MDFLSNNYIDEEVLLSLLKYSRPKLFPKKEGIFKGITLLKEFGPWGPQVKTRGIDYLADLLTQLEITKTNKVGKLIKDEDGSLKPDFNQEITLFDLIKQLKNEPFSENWNTYFIINNGSSKSAKRVREYLDGYIERFRKDELVENQNIAHLPYQKQKEYLFKSIIQEISNKTPEGDNIIIKINGKITTDDVSPIASFLSYEQEQLIKILKGPQPKTENGITKYSITIKVKKENLERFENERRKYTDEIIGVRTFYDFKNDILYVRGDKIKTNSDEQRRVLRIIFKDDKKIKEKWEYSKVTKDQAVDEIITNEKYKNFFSHLNHKIKEKTGIESFFEVHENWVKIRERYLA
ncbi:MAG: hypothetical protein WCO84_01905 [bacterium]